MSATIQWRIKALETSTDPAKPAGFVRLVHWECVATEGGTFDKVWNVTELEDDPEAFVDLANLTEAQVLAWVWTKIDRAQIEQGAAALLAARATPTTPPLPWSPAP